MLRLKFGDWQLKVHLYSRSVHRLLADHSKNVGLQRSCDLFVVTDHFINRSLLSISLSSCQINTFFVRTLPNGARSRILTKFLSHWLICRRSAQTVSACTYYRGLACEYCMVGTRYHIACWANVGRKFHNLNQIVFLCILSCFCSHPIGRSQLNIE